MLRKIYEGCLLTKKFAQEKEKGKVRKVNKWEMDSNHKLSFEIVNKEMLPREGRRYVDYYWDLGIMNALDIKEKVNLPALVIK